VHLLSLALPEQVQAEFWGMAGLVVLGLPAQAAQQPGASGIEARAAPSYCNVQQPEFMLGHHVLQQAAACTACRSSSQPHVPASITHRRACRPASDQFHQQQGRPRCRLCKWRPSWCQAEQCSQWCIWPCTCCRLQGRSTPRPRGREWLGWSCWCCQCKLHSRRQEEAVC
jgi:hypothetical protein